MVWDMANIIPIGAGPTTVGPIKLPNHNSTVVGQLRSAGAATGMNVKAQGRISDAAGWDDIKWTLPASKTDAATLTALNQIGYFENIGYNEVQFVQTGAIATADVEILLNIGNDQ